MVILMGIAEAPAGGGQVDMAENTRSMRHWKYLSVQVALGALGWRSLSPSVRIPSKPR